ncbi:probable protein phosphatase 1N isoform X1 [Panthera leo]|uniref:probable protein phosphatase 1N isoform X1 n=1 Tax=Panthera leo TaxID=9689 RepID=UPI0009058F70|nr:probable protein phosphatase 1N isoform X1 [Panthera leo]
MAAFARLLECLLWSARKEQEAEEEEEEGRRTHDGPRSLLDAPRCFQRPHGGAAASWGLRFGASAVQGWRAHMEDAHCAWLALPGLPPGWAFFAVLDGHGGARAALFGARHLPGHVFEALGTAPDEPEGVRGALRRAFLNADARLRALWPRGEPGGSTAVALLVSPRFLYLAHCGDSRAMLSRAGAVAFSTEDHRPLRPRERERIHNAGGTIRRRRLEGSLAVSRALGDFAYKEAPGRPPELQLVSAEPEVTALARQAEDEFMLLASDGVWDAMSGAALARLVASRLCLGLAPELLCAQLLDTCLCKGSLDNMTCVLVCFPGAPRPCEEAIRKELALDAALGRRVSELYSSAQEPPSLNTVFRTLASEDIPDLPPGGGLYCKVAVIAEAYSRLCQASGGRWQVSTLCSRMFLLETCDAALLPLVLGKLRPEETRDLPHMLINSHSWP